VSNAPEPLSPASLYWRLHGLEARVKDIEEVKPDALADRVETMAGEVRSLRRALWAFAAAVIIASITFALSVLSQAGAI
jgi:hypothetical protein